MNRREFLASTAAGIAITAVSGFSAPATKPPLAGRYRAVVFDGFGIFDPRPVFALAEEFFPGHGGELNALWKTRQFEYTWLRTMLGRYVDFSMITRDALVFATKSLKLNIASYQREELLDRYFHLQAWPDVAPALAKLSEAGLRLGLLSNFSEPMLRANIRSANLDGIFEQALSTDRMKAFKPDPRAYEMGTDAFQLEREQIIFAAFAGWDAVGAREFGYPTFWMNRQNAAEEELDLHPDASGSIGDLVKFATGTG